MNIISPGVYGDGKPRCRCKSCRPRDNWQQDLARTMSLEIQKEIDDEIIKRIVQIATIR
jgi:hypothetical protein